MGVWKYFFNKYTLIGAGIGTIPGHWGGAAVGSVLDLYQRVGAASTGNLQNVLHSTVSVAEYAGFGGFVGAFAGLLFAAKIRGWVYSFLKK